MSQRRWTVPVQQKVSTIPDMYSHAADFLGKWMTHWEEVLLGDQNHSHRKAFPSFLTHAGCRLILVGWPNCCTASDRSGKILFVLACEASEPLPFEDSIYCRRVCECLFQASMRLGFCNSESLVLGFQDPMTHSKFYWKIPFALNYSCGFLLK